MSKTRELIELTATIARVTGMKFCTQCNLTRPVAGGAVKTLPSGRTRWKCATCAAKKKPSGFTTKEKSK